jgi:hypothetical protein
MRVRLVSVQDKHIFMVFAKGGLGEFSYRFRVSAFRHGKNHVHGIALVLVPYTGGKIILPILK